MDISNGLKEDVPKKSCCSFGFCPNEGGRALPKKVVGVPNPFALGTCLCLERQSAKLARKTVHNDKFVKEKPTMTICKTSCPKQQFAKKVVKNDNFQTLQKKVHNNNFQKNIIKKMSAQFAWLT